MRARLIVAGALAALAALAAGCGSTATAAPHHIAAPAPASALKGCTALQNWNGSDLTAAGTISIELTGTQAGTDFGNMLSAISTGDSAEVLTAGNAVSADCAKVGVIINFNVTATD